jgi:alkylhydroperoxidase family enzyme
LQDEDNTVVEKLEAGDLENAAIDQSQRRLLEFVKKLTLEPAGTTDAEVEALRETGWTDPQIAEAVYVTALFAFFNRVADAFGLANPGYREQDTPPAQFE